MAIKAKEPSLVELQREELAQLTGRTAAMAEVVMALSTEVMRFVSARITEDVKTQAAMMDCKNFNDAQRIQVEYLTTARNQYAEELAKLTQLSTEALSNVTPKG